jgi:hypothetical protein
MTDHKVKKEIKPNVNGKFAMGGVPVPTSTFLVKIPAFFNPQNIGGHGKNTSIKNWGMDMNYETCSIF